MKKLSQTYDEIMKWRFIKSLISSSVMPVVMAVLVCRIVNVFISLDSWNPFSVLGKAIGCLHINIIIDLIIPIICNAVLLYIHSYSFSLVWFVPEKRFDYISQLINLKSFLSMTGMTFTCTVLMYHYGSIINEDLSSSINMCSTNQNVMCLNHNFFILTFVGISYGMRISLHYFIGNLNFVNGPVVPFCYTIGIKSMLTFQNFMNSRFAKRGGLLFLGGTLIFYGVIANIVTSWASALLRVRNYEHEWQLISMWINIPLLLTIALSLKIVAMHLHCFFTAFNNYVTAPVEIPICEGEPDATFMQDESSWNLKNALSSQTSHLKYVSLVHLRDIAKGSFAYGEAERSQIFSISRPGGHPYIWRGVSMPTISILRNFHNRLLDILVIESKNENQIKKDVNGNMKEKVKSAIHNMKRHPLFYVFFSLSTEGRTRKLFGECQSVIYAAEALANLVAASYKEDNYGVVQKDLKEIISQLVEIQRSIEKTLQFSERKSQNGLTWNTETPYDVILRKTLRSTIKTSIYTITVLFKDSMRDISFSPDVDSIIDSYLSFQEG